MRAGRVVTREDLLHRLWGPINTGSTRVTRTHLMRLRQKLGQDGENPTYIFVEPRVGIGWWRGNERAHRAMCMFYYQARFR